MKKSVLMYIELNMYSKWPISPPPGLAQKFSGGGGALSVSWACVWSTCTGETVILWVEVTQDRTKVRNKGCYEVD